MRITRSRTLGIGTLLCVGLLGFTRLGLTQNTQPAPVTEPEANPAPQSLADAASKIVIPDLSEADEKTVRVEWEKLQEQLEEIEIAFPAKAIDLYEQFMNGGASQYGDVAMEVVLHIGGLYYTELQNYDAAIKTYDWGLNAYPNFPAARQVRESRVIAAAKARGEEWRSPKIPDVGLKAPQSANKIQLEPVQIKTTNPAFPQALIKIDPKLVGSTEPVGVAKMATQANGGVVAKVEAVNRLNVTGTGDTKTQLPIASVSPKVGEIAVNNLVSVQTVAELNKPNQPSLATVSANSTQGNTLRSLSSIKFTPPSLSSASRRGDYGGWKMGPDRCVTALARQKSGRLWVATEDSGVWFYDEPNSMKGGTAPTSTAPRPASWKQVTAKDGLGDDSAYALAVDKQERVWVGTLNHGVSVWNGKSWKNYGILDGPLGERVFDIAVCPTDGDVWIATNAGLTRYSQSKDSWSYRSRADGLPSDQIQAIAFDKSGNLIVGAQCDGIAISTASSGYNEWQVVQGPEKMPTTPSGTGLPTNLINDILVAQDGTIYVATTMGLAWSTDMGASWSYVRGQDYAAKVRGLYNGSPNGWSAVEGAVLLEDYVSCLSEDSEGNIWLGHWQQGHEVLEKPGVVAIQNGADKTIFTLGNRSLNVSGQEASGFVRSILQLPQTQPLIARYDEGLSKAVTSVAASVNSKPDVVCAKPVLASTSDLKTEPETLAKPVAVSATTVVPFPTVASVPNSEDLNHLIKQIQSAENLQDKTGVFSMSEDWTTQGDWQGRYGRYFAVLCATVAPKNYVWGAGKEQVNYAISISPREKNNSLRYWVSELYTNDRRTLEMPSVYNNSRQVKGLNKVGGKRRQSEVDDNGEAYPLTKEGPNIYASVQVPSGLYVLSFYNYNKDGYTDSNRLRDYKISLRSHPDDIPLSNVKDFDKWPELAHNRQRDFRGGVYQKYLVRGPQSITIEYAKNNSLNTILTGIFLDKVDDRSGGQEPDPYFTQVNHPGDDIEPKLPDAALVSKLWEVLETARTTNPIWWASEGRRYYAPLARWHENARNLVDREGTPRFLMRLGSCHYYLNSFTKWEETQRKRNLIPARDIESDLKWDKTTIEYNGNQNFSGQGRKTITGYLERALVPIGPRS